MADEDLDRLIYGDAGRPQMALPGILRVVGGSEANRRKALVATPARFPDPKTIPPRRWLLGTQLLLGYVSVLVAPGGTGKSVYAMTAAMSIASDIELLGLKVWQRVNAWVINEDPIEELDRRFAAIMLRNNLRLCDVEARVFVNSMDERGVTIAEKGPDGFTVVYPDAPALIEQIHANRIGFLVVDPYAESHSLEENSNPDMVKAARAWRRVARETNCAILLIHHVRKGKDGSIDDSRGAKGLTDSARVGLVMSNMAEDEAESLGVAKEDRLGFVRIDDGKVNLSPRGRDARWFHLDQVELGNCDRTYPNGDSVAALVPWSPTKAAALTMDVLSAILAAIDGGPGDGILFSINQRGGGERWAGKVIVDKTGMREKQAQDLLDKWLRSGHIFLYSFKHPGRRKQMEGLKVDFSRGIPGQ